MISLKVDVKLTDLCSQIVLALIVVDSVLSYFGITRCVVTSVNDGKHSDASWHYKGRAIDIRTKYPQLDGREIELRDKVRECLGSNFDVVIEDVSKENEHLHIEYDPK